MTWLLLAGPPKERSQDRGGNSSRPESTLASRAGDEVRHGPAGQGADDCRVVLAPGDDETEAARGRGARRHLLRAELRRGAQRLGGVRVSEGVVQRPDGRVDQEGIRAGGIGEGDEDEVTVAATVIPVVPAVAVVHGRVDGDHAAVERDRAVVLRSPVARIQLIAWRDADLNATVKRAQVDLKVQVRRLLVGRRSQLHGVTIVLTYPDPKGLSS